MYLIESGSFEIFIEKPIDKLNKAISSKSLTKRKAPVRVALVERYGILGLKECFSYCVEKFKNGAHSIADSFLREETVICNESDSRVIFLSC